GHRARIDQQFLAGKEPQDRRDVERLAEGRQAALAEDAQSLRQREHGAEGVAVRDDVAREADLVRPMDQLDRAVPLQFGGRAAVPAAACRGDRLSRRGRIRRDHRGGRHRPAAPAAARDDVMAARGVAVHVVQKALLAPDGARCVRAPLRPAHDDGRPGRLSSPSPATSWPSQSSSDSSSSDSSSSSSSSRSSSSEPDVRYGFGSPAGDAFWAALATSASRARALASRSSMWAAFSIRESMTKVMLGVCRTPVFLPTSDLMTPLALSSAAAVSARSPSDPYTV